MELFERHVELFNAGVRTGDFGPMLEQFADDAELRFEGVPVGPFRGRDAIAAAYAANPPDDEIDVFDVSREVGTVVATYGWRRDRGRAAGRMILEPRDGRIDTLVVTFQ